MLTMIRSTASLAFAFVLLWNSGFIGAEYALPHAPTFTLMFWRYWTLTLILAVSLSRTRRLRLPGTGAVRHAMLVGILSHGVWLSCATIALNRGVPAGIVALVVALQPLATGALSGWMTGERTPPHRWVGLVVGFAGVCVVLLNRIEFDDFESVFAYLIPLLSVMAMTIASLLQRRAKLSHENLSLPADLDLFFQGFGTALAVTLPAIWLEGLATEWNGELIGALLWLVLAVSLGAYGMMWQLIARIDATRVASLFYLGPPVTMLLAWVAFGDTLQGSDILGLAIVFAGVGLTYRHRARIG
ncbi:DMT family transporter [Lyngbya sp. CCY1209]|uniref:DMT family transporter n=1 Tax=Lyngbya sp. CCY1209 TaxID=2886103 RepID=UPI002D210941|nr:DMT family transporter [Lyngbya sp. CCY1209]MEB3884462.1 DMT family transporter [Lyngbya sp. CCY1209]